MPEDAFQESTEPRRSTSKSLKLQLNEDGSIDWESTSEKHTQAFIEAIKVDANGILQNIREEAGQSGALENNSSIADATVVAAINMVMVVEAIGITTIGPKFAPPLRNLHPIVAIKACAVSQEELQPIMEPSKRLIEKYVPTKYLTQDAQDIALIGQHLIKLSAEKFKVCIELAQEIERMKTEGEVIPPNGRGSKVEIH